MEHFIIGTAGHIDHGKTSLVKALTQMDCDTHPEEKKRGITINLGFAYLPITKDKYLAFVDVPGHHRFINNMISGVSGIDFVMLVIAANDGVMPQTIEHLRICSLLGIKNGIVVITKMDAVDEEQLEFCKEEIAEFVENTFLKDKAVFTVSSISGEGIPELKNYLLNENYQLILKERQDFFRMYVDRVFTISGFGSVATGTVLSGLLNLNESIQLFPTENEVRVRQIQRHGESVEMAQQGTRIAINVTGLKKRELQAGDILSKIHLALSSIIDVKITLLDKIKKNTNRFDALLLIGTYKTSAQIKLLDEDQAGTKTERFAQIHLKNEWYFVKGDHFILRNTSSNVTIGGGVIIDPLPLNHKRKSAKLVESLKKSVDNTLAYIEFKITESIRLTSIDYFVQILQLKETNILKILNKSKTLRTIKSLSNTYYILERKLTSQYKHAIINKLEIFHKNNPLSLAGVSKNKLTLFTKDLHPFIDPSSNDKILSVIIEEMVNEKKLIRLQNCWKLPSQRTKLSIEEKSQINYIESLFSEEGLNGFSMEKLTEKAALKGIHKQQIDDITNYLLIQKIIILHGKQWYYNPEIAKVRKLLIDFLKQSSEGITVSQFRDLIQTNRKLSIQFFEIFESEKLVIRKGDIRVLKAT